MILSEMFEAQEKLDSYIMSNVEEKMTLEELYSDRVLAVLVELAEVANASRCFKYWSKKESEPKERTLDELADVMHFILSIGNMIGKDIIDEYNFNPVCSYSDTVNQLINLNRICAWLQAIKDLDLYVNVMENFLGLVILMGFEFKDLEIAYYKKQEVNYQRQRENY